MDTDILIFLVFMIIILIILIYSSIGVEDQIHYVNNYTNDAIVDSKKSTFNLEEIHLNKTIVLTGGMYEINLRENLQNKNGTIKIVHLEDDSDKISINYKSNIQVVEYETNIIVYDPGSNPIDGNIHVYPLSKGFFRANYHTTTIMINKNLTSVHVECIIADDFNLT